MVLDRLVTCTPFDINAPMWLGGRKAVGLNERRIGQHNEINFGYVRKSDGKKSIPDTYYISGKKIRNGNYPIMITKGVSLVIIPFIDLEILERK